MPGGEELKAEVLGGQNITPAFKIQTFWYLYKNEKISAVSVDF